jgi:hypothetical protein
MPRHPYTAKLGTRAWAGQARGKLTSGERFELARRAALVQIACSGGCCGVNAVAEQAADACQGAIGE